MLYWEGFTTGTSDSWQTSVSDGSYEFMRTREFNSENPLFGDDINMNSVQRGDKGDASLMAALGSLAVLSLTQ